MAVNVWSAAGAGNWNVAGNWSLGHVPQAGEDVVFDNTSVQDCTLDVNTADLGDFTIADIYTGTFTFQAFKSISATGDWYFGTMATLVYAAFSQIYIKAAAAQTITSNGNTLPRLNDWPAVAGSVQLADPLTCQQISIVAIPFDQNGHAITTTTATVSITSAGSVLDDEVTLAVGTISFNGAADWSAATVTLLTGGSVSTFASTTVRRLILTVGQTYTFTAAIGSPLVISNYTAGDWDGTVLTGLVTWYMSAPAGVVVSNVNVANSNNGGPEIDASDGTNTDGGGNTGWNFGGGGGGGGGVPGHSCSSVSVGVGVGT
jgi:hypothetical protein